MLRTLALAALLLVAALPAQTADTSQPFQINGFGPYRFGMSMKQALAADPKGRQAVCKLKKSRPTCVEKKERLFGRAAIIQALFSEKTNRLHKVRISFDHFKAPTGSQACSLSRRVVFRGLVRRYGTEVLKHPVVSIGLVWRKANGRTVSFFPLCIALDKGLVVVVVDSESGYYQKAVSKLKRRAQRGDAVSQYNLGIMYANGQGVPKNYREAVRWYRKAALQGHPEAQHNLGGMYASGRGVPKNYREALRWFSKAALRGVPRAQLNLGIMYEFGKGTPRNYRKAVKWYRRAAMQGNVTAQYNLGGMYWQGRGVPKNYVMAYYWRSLAASTGNKRAAKGLDILEKQMTPADVSKAQAMAAKWRPKKVKR